MAAVLEILNKIEKGKTEKSISSDIVEARKNYEFDSMDSEDREKLGTILKMLADTENNNCNHISGICALVIACLSFLIEICQNVYGLIKIGGIPIGIINILFIACATIMSIYSIVKWDKLTKSRNKYLIAYFALLLSQNERETEHKTEKKGEK